VLTLLWWLFFRQYLIGRILCALLVRPLPMKGRPGCRWSTEETQTFSPMPAYARPRVDSIHGLRVSGITDSDGCEIRCATRILFGRARTSTAWPAKRSKHARCGPVSAMQANQQENRHEIDKHWWRYCCQGGCSFEHFQKFWDIRTE
jgi:hypothetical protein